MFLAFTIDQMIHNPGQAPTLDNAGIFLRERLLHRELSLLASLWTIRSYAAVAAFEFSPAFQRRVSCGKRLASRQRRLISGVADATRRLSHIYRGLKPTAKFKCRYRGRKI
jgi:hypothetical protein